jgi:hypothetical protein
MRDSGNPGDHGASQLYSCGLQAFLVFSRHRLASIDQTPGFGAADRQQEGRNKWRLKLVF